jgi:hypothetical protein
VQQARRIIVRYLEDTGIGMGAEGGIEGDSGPESDASVIETQDSPQGGTD